MLVFQNQRERSQSISNCFFAIAFIAAGLFIMFAQSDFLTKWQLDYVATVTNSMNSNETFFVGNISCSDSEIAALDSMLVKLHKIRPITKNIKNTNKKIILLWRQYFSDPWLSYFKEFGSITLPGGKNRSCMITMNRQMLDKSDAIVLHVQDLTFYDLPKLKLPSQRLVFYSIESPLNTRFDEGKVNSLGFNWTMTYLTKSNVWMPYCHYKKWQPMENESKIIDCKIRRFANNFRRREKDIAWFVSHCKTDSKREQLAEKLQEYNLTIDSFGRCSGKKPDDELKSLGFSGFFSRYRYYFAAENSLCEDYVTEKLSRGLNGSIHVGLIPIVYGSQNYSKYAAPAGSYIDVESFESVKHLADYLNLLKEPDQEETVLSYFQWQKSFLMGDDSYRFGFLDLCKKLFDEDDKCSNSTNAECGRSTVEDMKSRLGSCRKPKFPL